MATKKDEPTAAAALTTPTPYEIFSLDPIELQEMIMENLGGRALSINDLVTYKVPGGGAMQWTVKTPVGEGDPVSAVEGIIIGSKPFRQHYKKGLDEGGGNEPPDCQSDDMLHGKGDPGGDCTTCPLNEFKSAKNGLGKACREKIRVFIAVPDDILPQIVVIPSASLDAYEGFMTSLIGKHRTSYPKSVVRFAIKREKNQANITYGEVEITFVRKLTADEQKQFNPYRASLYRSLTGKDLPRLAVQPEAPPQVEHSPMATDSPMAPPMNGVTPPPTDDPLLSDHAA